MKVRKLSERDRMFTIGTAVESIDDFTGESVIKFEVAEGDEFHYISKTRYPYDGKDFPFFDMNLDLKEAYKRLSQAGNSLQIIKCAPGSTKPRGVEVIERLLAEGIEDTDEGSGYLKVGAYAKKYRMNQDTARSMCDDGRVEFYTTDGGHRMVADKPPRPK
ncbi:MAG: hypothetical protein MUO82_03655 [Candidatus Thermoplasmatota archaeon]|nr:hypothetical protein [Candidatus Thermoplasmatota archaeon]